MKQPRGRGLPTDDIFLLMWHHQPAYTRDKSGVLHGSQGCWFLESSTVVAILIHSWVLGKADGVESEDPSFNYRNIYRRNM